MTPTPTRRRSRANLDPVFDGTTRVTVWSDGAVIRFRPHRSRDVVSIPVAVVYAIARRSHTPTP